MGLCYMNKRFKLWCLSVILMELVLMGHAAQIVKDEASLLSFMAGIVQDPNQVLAEWNNTTSSETQVCNWFGLKCNNESSSRVTELDLSGCSLAGTISSSLASLSYLTVLDLSRNFFEGRIPLGLGRVSRLRQLSLSSNLLTEDIPEDLGMLRNLIYLDLGSNSLSSEIPSPIFCNMSLEYIDMSNNSLSGEIPLTSQCELKELRFLLLWSNKLVGRIPLGLSNSTKLEWLDLESNLLTGELPADMVRRMPYLQFLYLSYNDFVSHDDNSNLHPFFAALANSSNLQELELAGNSLGGNLPHVIGKLSTKLVQIHLDDNLIHGSIPPQISNLVNLTLLNLSSNLLNGSIPSQLGKMAKLERLYMSNNSLSGSIPDDIGNIPHLGLLDLSKNKLSGSIPDSFANLSQLRKLLLYQNQLSGMIPTGLGNCTNLEILDLSQNSIVGMIPNKIAGLRSFKLYLNLSSNHLHGPIPLELSKMDMIQAIDLSSNNLSGSIPTQLGSCIALEYLNISNNFFEGPLPDSLGQLPYLQVLDMSSNNLSGQIPQTFMRSSSLKQANFSFNDFSGNVSNEGVFSLLTFESFLGNRKLCGMIHGMKTCRRRRPHILLLPVLLPLSITFMVFIFGYPLARMRRPVMILGGGRNLEDPGDGNSEYKYPRLSYSQLVEATGGFCSSSLIGSGQFGHVYKGVLKDNTRVAVKVLDHSKSGGDLSGSFKRECQVLKRTRHRNLIKIITICSKPDFKALVLPLMSNGSLERHLYPSDHNSGHSHLTLAQVISICTDVAEGVAYLHHHSPVRVVHCDLKPSNILLDDDMTALVADFGIARLAKGAEQDTSANEPSSYNSTDGLLCGSIGYIAPEYGMGKRASTQGDVFSFGVLLLEIIVGRRPTDVLVDQASSLHEWVKSQFPSMLEPIISQALIRYTPPPAELDQTWHDVVEELVELGLLCTQSNPSTRPNMMDVCIQMNSLKQSVTTNPSLQVTLE
ncbi:unnamed protein product [Rhodiola kirilowii]